MSDPMQECPRMFAATRIGEGINEGCKLERENAALREALICFGQEWKFLIEIGQLADHGELAQAEALVGAIPAKHSGESSQGHSESFGSEPFTPCGDCPTPLSCGNSGCAVQLVERAIKEDCLCPSWVVSCSKADCQRKQQSAEGHSQDTAPNQQSLQGKENG